MPICLALGFLALGRLVLDCLWICVGLGKRHYPTGILILLGGKFAGAILSVFSNIPVLDGRFFLILHPLSWGLHNRSIRNLAAIS